MWQCMCKYPKKYPTDMRHSPNYWSSRTWIYPRTKFYFKNLHSLKIKLIKLIFNDMKFYNRINNKLVLQWKLLLLFVIISLNLWILSKFILQSKYSTSHSTWLAFYSFLKYRHNIYWIKYHWVEYCHCIY